MAKQQLLSQLLAAAWQLQSALEELPSSLASPPFLQETETAATATHYNVTAGDVACPERSVT